MNNVHEWSSTPFHCYSAQFCATQQSTSVRDDQVFETTYRTSKHTHSFSKMRSQVGFTALRSWSCVLINDYCRSCFESSSGSCSFFKRFSIFPIHEMFVVGQSRRRSNPSSRTGGARTMFKACHGKLVVRINWRILWYEQTMHRLWSWMFFVEFLCVVPSKSSIHVYALCQSHPCWTDLLLFALLGTLSSIWCNWYLLCHVQWAPMMLLSGWCLPVPLMMACFDASLSHSWI